MNYVSTVVIGLAVVALVVGLNLALKKPPVLPEVVNASVRSAQHKPRLKRAKHRRKAPAVQHAGIAPAAPQLAAPLLPNVKGMPTKALAMPRLPRFHELPDAEDRLLPGYDAQTSVQPGEAIVTPPMED